MGTPDLWLLGESMGGPWDLKLALEVGAGLWGSLVTLESSVGIESSCGPPSQCREN